MKGEGKVEMNVVRSSRQWLPRARKVLLWGAMLSALLVLGACADVGTATGGPSGGAASGNIEAIKTVTAFDPSDGALLPYNRIVAAYGIVGGVEFNGAASNLDLLSSYLPQLQQLGKEYATLDPVHPVKLGIDLVVNVIQPCYAFPKWCASWADSDTIQAYIDFCQKHNLQLFFDLQLGTEPVSDAVNNYLLQYLSKYTFTHLALDTEFHFPNTPQGYAMAQGYPCCLGWMDAVEINWAIDKLAQISLVNHLPRKVLVIHEWNSAVLTNENKIKRNPNVSVVLQSDGFGGIENKLGDYQIFVQQALLQYGGYKIFYNHPGGAAFDEIVQTPEEIMHLFPQPLFISYE
jgi:hypothetical protein